MKRLGLLQEKQRLSSSFCSFGLFCKCKTAGTHSHPVRKSHFPKWQRHLSVTLFKLPQSTSLFIFLHFSDLWDLGSSFLLRSCPSLPHSEEVYTSGMKCLHTDALCIDTAAPKSSRTTEIPVIYFFYYSFTEASRRSYFIQENKLNPRNFKCLISSHVLLAGYDCPINSPLRCP